VLEKHVAGLTAELLQKVFLEVCLLIHHQQQLSSSKTAAAVAAIKQHSSASSEVVCLSQPEQTDTPTRSPAQLGSSCALA
jgi:hypothetical protein